jgi:succinyl-CoA synthetase alpha subunit
MGHAGAIVGADGSGGAEAKEAALREAGVHIALGTEHIVEILKTLL